LLGLQISPTAQAPLWGLLLQLSRAPVHESLVQATSSSQSLALQQLPQLAPVLSALGQHCSPGPHSGEIVHLPPWHEPTVQGSSSLLHCSSLQHSSAQPSAQHRLPCAQKSFLQKPLSQTSVVQALESSQPVPVTAASQATLSLQLSVTEQASPARHLPSSGMNMHWPAKQVFVVHATPSSQSESSQQPAQSPSQQRCGPEHLGAASHLPSVVQKSLVQASPSSQSCGPTQRGRVSATPPPEPPALLPPLVAPAELPPVELSLASNAAPPQALASATGPIVRSVATTRSLGWKTLMNIPSARRRS
jgi:hypothetical protein